MIVSVWAIGCECVCDDMCYYSECCHSCVVLSIASARVFRNTTRVRNPMSQRDMVLLCVCVWHVLCVVSLYIYMYYSCCCDRP